MTKIRKVLSGIIILVSFFTLSATANAQNKVDINSATLEELQKLDGIGRPLAEKIISNRLYGSVDDLKRVQGIGSVKLSNIKKQGLAYVGELEKVELNTATFEQLLTLDSVESVLAQKIIDNRPFENLEDLKNIQGIGPTKFNNIKNQGLAYIAEKEPGKKLVTINYAWNTVGTHDEKVKEAMTIFNSGIKAHFQIGYAPLYKMQDYFLDYITTLSFVSSTSLPYGKPGGDEVFSVRLPEKPINFIENSSFNKDDFSKISFYIDENDTDFVIFNTYYRKSSTSNGIGVNCTTTQSQYSRFNATHRSIIAKYGDFNQEIDGPIHSAWQGLWFGDDLITLDLKDNEKLKVETGGSASSGYHVTDSISKEQYEDPRLFHIDFSKSDTVWLTVNYSLYPNYGLPMSN